MTALSPAAVPHGLGTSAGRVVGVLLALTALVDVAYLAGLIITNGDNDPVVNIGLSLASQWVPVSVFWVVAARTRFHHAALLIACLAVTVSAIGDSYWTLAAGPDGDLDFPSPADIGYVLFYPLMFAALVVLARRHLAGVGRLVLLETAVAAVGAAAVLELVLDPAIQSATRNDGILGVAVGAAYPLFDLILLAGIVGVASARAIPITRHAWALIAGLAIFIVADVVFAVLENNDAYVAGTPLDATWAVGLALITWWGAGVPDSAIDAPAPLRRRTYNAIPAIAVLAGLVLLIVATRVDVSPLAVALAATTVALGIAPLVFRQAMLGRLLAAQDVAVTRLTELDRAKSTMITTINHEFRTPLTAITGHVELLLDGGAGDLPPAAIDTLQTVERNSRRLQELIDVTFASSRLDESPALHVDEPVGIAQLVHRATAGVETLASRRGAEIVVTEPDASLATHGDVEQLERMLVSVLDNALKYGGDEPRIGVSARATGGGVVIQVSDGGIGIPTEEQADIFSRFYRASNARRAAIPGVGLGLSVARQIVAAHGGSITVESAVGTGTTVTIRLPLTTEASPATVTVR
jgi:signal transduction histidine kinase